ncbi:MAG TPA: FtsX-like permease family protein, partial [Vicinamibacterales bacterium]|nr:FtsX-like permease family protein [Vicinamibacterales bacterium]
DTGINTERVLVVGVPLPPVKYNTLEGRNRFAEEVLQRVSALPGVEAATFGLPFGGPQVPFTIAGQGSDEAKRIVVNLIGADHLRTFGVPLRSGRMFDASEVRRGDRVAVINEAAVKLWPAGENPIGARLQLPVLARPPARALVDTSRAPEVTIVGVIGDTRNAGLRAEPNPAVLVPYTLLAQPQRALAVRSAGDPNLLLNPIRAAVRAIDADQPLARPITLQEILGQEFIQPRFTMTLFSAFALLGLALAAAGIYSVLSFHVSRRTHELGVRMALGAPRRHVLGLMLKMGGQLVAVGLAIGVFASFASTRLLRSQLFGVEPADPLAYAMVTIILAIVAFAACYVPARRAAGVDPMIALRQE